MDAADARRELRIHASLHPAATLAAADATTPSAPAALAVLALRALVAHAEPSELPALVAHPIVADTAQQHGLRAIDGLRVYDVSSAVEAHAAGNKWGRNALYIFRMQNIGCMSEGTTWTDNGTWLRRTEPHGMVSADEAYALWRRDCSTMSRRQLRLHVDMPIRLILRPAIARVRIQFVDDVRSWADLEAISARLRDDLDDLAASPPLARVGYPEGVWNDGQEEACWRCVHAELARWQSHYGQRGEWEVNARAEGWDLRCAESAEPATWNADVVDHVAAALERIVHVANARANAPDRPRGDECSDSDSDADGEGQPAAAVGETRSLWLRTETAHAHAQYFDEDFEEPPESDLVRLRPDMVRQQRFKRAQGRYPEAIPTGLEVMHSVCGTQSCVVGRKLPLAVSRGRRHVFPLHRFTWAMRDRYTDHD